MNSGSSRRDVLRGLAATGLASIAATAGCATAGPLGDGQRELPPYHRYVPAEGPEGEGVFYASLDMARLKTLEDGELEEGLPEGAELGGGGDVGMDFPDPLVAYPAAGLFVVALGVGFGLVPYGFSDEVAGGFSETPIGEGAPTPGGSEGGSADADGGTRVDALVLHSAAIVLEGSFEPAAIADAADGFQPAGERGDFEVYVGTGGGSTFDVEALAFGVSEDAIVALVNDDRDDPRARIEAAIDVASGDGDRLSGDADADWALRTAGHGFTALGGWGLDPDEAAPTAGARTGDLGVESALDEADGLVSSLAYDEADAATVATVAAVYPEGETPDRDRLAEELGTGAREREIEIDGSRVTVTARWTAAGTTDAESG